MKRLAVIVVCISALLSLLGCKKKDNIEPTGMEVGNVLAWDSFSVSRSCDSYAQHNFCITVKCYADGYVVKGTLINCEEEEGVVLPRSACRKIDSLQPQNLPDAVFKATENAPVDEDIIFDGILLDAPTIEVLVEYTDGTLHSKVDEDNFSIKVYEIVEPYFTEKFY